MPTREQSLPAMAQAAPEIPAIRANPNHSNNNRRPSSSERSHASNRSRRSYSAERNEASDRTGRSRESRRDRQPRPNENRRERRQSPGPSGDSPSSGDDHEYRRRRQRNQREVTMKPIPVNQWRISFSGDPNSSNKHDLNIHNFIEQVELFRRSSGISQDMLLLQIIHLLTGSARAWFQNESRHIETWDQFVRALRANFLPSDYNFVLIAQATQRRQRKAETVAEYVNAMELLFRAMSVPMSAEHQLYLVRQNLLPQYGIIVASHSPRNIAEVKRICKEIESATAMQNRRDAYALKSAPGKDRTGHRSVHAAETVDSDAADTGESSENDADTNKCAAVKSGDSRGKPRERTEKARPANAQAKSSKTASNQVEACYNCRGEGHDQRQCKLRWRKHCYNCGKPDVVTKDCPVCNEASPKNAQVNQAEMKQEDSQSDSAS